MYAVTDVGDANASSPLDAASTGSDNVTNDDIAMATAYGLICAVGLIGHGLVLFAVARESKDTAATTAGGGSGAMQRAAVTNIYIVSLSLADTTFLVGLPFIIVTLLAKRWMFGSALCKVYFLATCVSTFAGAFTLTAMSADRCAAVCWPLVSRTCNCRTPFHARLVTVAIWGLATATVLPVVVYAQLVPSDRGVSCTISFPDDDLDATMIYSIYTLVLGFIIPVLLISIFYAGLVLKLRSCRTTVVVNGNGQCYRRPQHSVVAKWRSRRITWLVTSVVVVYVGCWLPYWVFQVHLIMCQRDDRGSLPLPSWKVFMFQLFTVLSYANSAINPFLYAFASSQFRQSFEAAFLCRRPPLYGSTDAAARHVAGAAAAEDSRMREGATTVPGQSASLVGRRGSVSTAVVRQFVGGRLVTTTCRKNGADEAVAVVVEMHDRPDGKTGRVGLEAVRCGTTADKATLMTEL